MKIDLSIDPQKTAHRTIEFIRITTHQTGFSRLVVGLSGGVDSAACCALTVNAIGARNLFVALLPYSGLNQSGLKDAKSIIEKLGIPGQNVYLADIKSIVDQIIRQDPSIDKLRAGNIMARLRMIFLYDLSKKLNALVLGTENKTEYLLGYFTRFGDEAGDLQPIRGLYKTQVRQLAASLGIPEKIIQKAPTAGMWSGQTDEKEMGFTYRDADKILYLYVDLHKSIEEIIKVGFKEEIVESVITRLQKNDFKHKVPYICVAPLS